MFEQAAASVGLPWENIVFDFDIVGNLTNASAVADMDGSLRYSDNEAKFVATLTADKANIPPRLQDYTILPGGRSRYRPVDLLFHRREHH